jgi:hypothetical protein
MALLQAPPDVQELVENRTIPRFALTDSVRATFNGAEVSLVNISAGGFQIEHASSLRIGTGGVLTIYADDTFEVRGRIVWSRFSTTAGGSTRYRSGARYDGDLGPVAASLGRFLRAYGRREEESLQRKAQAIRQRRDNRQNSMKYYLTVSQPSGSCEDQTLMIEQARQLLACSPDESLKWYNRARYALNDRLDLASQLSGVPFREEAIAVWEYLERRVDITMIVKVFHGPTK